MNQKDREQLLQWISRLTEIQDGLDAMLAHGYPREFPGSRKETAKDVRREALMDEAFCLVAHRRFALPEDLGAETARDDACDV